jgi:hypothetical protein
MKQSAASPARKAGLSSGYQHDNLIHFQGESIIKWGLIIGNQSASPTDYQPPLTPRLASSTSLHHC